MKKLSKTLVATLLVGVIGATSFSSLASARDGAQGNGPNANRDRVPQNAQQARGPGGALGFGPVRLVCSDRGAARIEDGLSHIGLRIDLGDEQAAALEDLKTAALLAQSVFAELCVDLKPGHDADLIERMNSRQAMVAAQLVGVKSVMPSLEIFFDSLTDEQKADLRPPVDRYRDRGPGFRGGPNQSNAPANN